jgi:hypothetical protein
VGLKQPILTLNDKRLHTPKKSYTQGSVRDENA